MLRNVILCMLIAAPVLGAAQTQWVLDNATLTYHMSHPIHQVDGTSTEAKGKGTCERGQCSFLIAAPVKSFTSGDSNRDLHMVQVTRGAQFPMVVVKATLPQAIDPSGTVYADLDVQFAGQTAHYAHVPFQETTSGNKVHIAGTVPAKCSDFKIDPPSFLTVKIKDEIPVRVEMSWHSL